MNKQLTSTSFFKADRLPYLLILLAGFLIYGNSLQNQYVLDDYVVFVNNTHVQEGISGINKILTTNYLNGINGFNDGLYRPMSQVSFAVEKSIYDLNPKWMHFWNVLIYVISICLVFAFLKKLFDQKHQNMVLLICLLFLSHPLHTELVANLKGRDELFSFLGFAAAAFTALLYFDSTKTKYLIQSVLAFGFALFSKESAIVYLAFIPVLIMIKYPFKRSSHWYKIVGSYLLMSIFFLLTRFLVLSNLDSEVDQGIFGLLNNPIAAEASMSLKWGAIFSLQPLFLSKLFYPFPLLHDYSFNAIVLNPLTSINAILGIIILAGLSILSIISLKRRNVWNLIAASYLISNSVVSQILLPIGTHFAERLLFLSVLPFAIAFVFGLLYVFRNLLKQSSKSANQITLILVSILILFFGFKSYERSKDWKDKLSLYAADVVKGSQSARINYNYGTELSQQSDGVNNLNQKSQMLNTSILHLEKAIAIYPDYKDAYNNLGLAYKKAKNYDKAIKTYQTAILRDPNYSKNYYNLSTVYFEIQQYKQCIEYMSKYVSLQPNSHNAYYLLGQAAGYLNEFSQAENYLEQAIRLQPKSVAAMNFLAMAKGMQGKYPEAEQIFLNALNVDPDNLQVLTNLSINYYQQQKYDNERQILSRILQIDPNNQAAKSRLK